MLLLFLLMNAPDFVSSEPSTKLLLIILSSSFFSVTSTAVAAAAAPSSSSSSSWSEYWLRASTSSLKTSSLIKPPSRTQSACHDLKTDNNLFRVLRFYENSSFGTQTSVTMDTIIVINELLQESLVLFQYLIAHVRDVMEERLILYLQKHKKGRKAQSCV